MHIRTTLSIGHGAWPEYTIGRAVERHVVKEIDRANLRKSLPHEAGAGLVECMTFCSDRAARSLTRDVGIFTFHLTST